MRTLLSPVLAAAPRQVEPPQPDRHPDPPGAAPVSSWHQATFQILAQAASGKRTIIISDFNPRKLSAPHFVEHIVTRRILLYSLTLYQIAVVIEYLSARREPETVIEWAIITVDLCILEEPSLQYFLKKRGREAVGSGGTGGKAGAEPTKLHVIRVGPGNPNV